MCDNQHSQYIMVCIIHGILYIIYTKKDILSQKNILAHFIGCTAAIYQYNDECMIGRHPSV